jgi:hypothetical protein
VVRLPLVTERRGDALHPFHRTVHARDAAHDRKRLLTLHTLEHSRHRVLAVPLFEFGFEVGFAGGAGHVLQKLVSHRQTRLTARCGNEAVEDTRDKRVKITTRLLRRTA